MSSGLLRRGVENLIVIGERVNYGRLFRNGYGFSKYISPRLWLDMWIETRKIEIEIKKMDAEEKNFLKELFDAYETRDAAAMERVISDMEDIQAERLLQSKKRTLGLHPNVEKDDFRV